VYQVRDRRVQAFFAEVGGISPDKLASRYRLLGHCWRVSRYQSDGQTDNFRFARDSSTITKVSETTACRALPNTRGKAGLPKRKGGHHHDQR
jgi:hypothetical protein